MFPKPRPSLHAAAWRFLRLVPLIGVFFTLGCLHERVPASSTCSVNTPEIWPGEPVKATVTPNGFDRKHKLNHDWTTNGGKVEGSGGTVTINTTGIAEGQTYNVSAHVTDPHNKKAVSSCQTSFSTRKRLPPTINCNATPDTITQKDSVTINSTASSPQGNQVKVTITSICAGGGEGTAITLNTTMQTSTGTCNVTCNVADEYGLTGSSSTSFNVREYHPAVLHPPSYIALRSIYFASRQPEAKSPDKGLASSQQQTLRDIATAFRNYQAEVPGAKLLLQAYADEKEGDDDRGSLKLTQRRLAITKKYLVSQGVAENSIQTQAFGRSHKLTEAEVKADLDKNPEFNQLTAGERTRILNNIGGIELASNRRVDFSLITSDVYTVQTTIRQYPFGSANMPTLIGGKEKQNEKPEIACSADLTKPVVGQTVNIHCDVINEGAGSITLMHTSNHDNRQWNSTDFSVTTSNWKPGDYFVNSTATDARAQTGFSKIFFTVQASPTLCSLAMFLYQSPIDLSGISRPETQFAVVIGKRTQDVTTRALQLGLCAADNGNGTSAKLDRCSDLKSFLDSCACNAATKSFNNDEVWVKPIDAIVETVTVTIPDAGEIRPTHEPGKPQKINPSAGWEWEGKTPDVASPILKFDLDEEGAGQTNGDQWRITLKTRTGFLMHIRVGFWWLVGANNLWAKLAAIFATLVTIWTFIKKPFSRKIPQPAPAPQQQQQTTPTIIVVQPKEPVQEPPQRPTRRRPFHRRDR